MWGAGIARRAPWREVPLRRGADRVQAWCTLVLAAVTLVAGPWAAWWAGTGTYRSEARASAWEARNHRPVAAVLTRDAPAPADTGGEGPPAPPFPRVPARWTAPDGTIRSAPIPVAPGTPAGSAVTVWVDHRGTVVAPPRRRHPIAGAWAAAAFAGCAVALLASGVRRIVIGVLDRHRLRCWETEWSVVGPLWSRR